MFFENSEILLNHSSPNWLTMHLIWSLVSNTMSKFINFLCSILTKAFNKLVNFVWYHLKINASWIYDTYLSTHEVNRPKIIIVLAFVYISIWSQNGMKKTKNPGEKIYLFTETKLKQICANFRTSWVYWTMRSYCIKLTFDGPKLSL